MGSKSKPPAKCKEKVRPLTAIGATSVLPVAADLRLCSRGRQRERENRRHMIKTGRLAWTRTCVVDRGARWLAGSKLADRLAMRMRNHPTRARIISDWKCLCHLPTASQKFANHTVCAVLCYCFHKPRCPRTAPFFPGLSCVGWVVAYSDRKRDTCQLQVRGQEALASVSGLRAPSTYEINNS